MAKICKTVDSHEWKVCTPPPDSRKDLHIELEARDVTFNRDVSLEEVVTLSEEDRANCMLKLYMSHGMIVDGDGTPVTGKAHFVRFLPHNESQHEPIALASPIHR